MSLEAEQTVIGAMMIDPNVVPVVLETLSAEDFENATCRMIFEICSSLFMASKRADVLTVLNEGRERYKWSQADYDQYKVHIARLAQMVPTTTNTMEYANIVKVNAVRRRAKSKAYDLYLALEESAPLDECQAIAAEVCDAINNDAKKQAVSAKEGLLNFIHSQDKPQEFIETGIPILDTHGRHRKGHLVIVAGRPSAGKTAFTLQAAMNISKSKVVVYFSLETSEEEVYERALSCYTGIPYDNILDKKGVPWEKVAEFSDAFSKLKLYVIDAAGWTVEQMNATAARLRADVVFIDYVQLVSGRGKDETERVTLASRAIKEMSRKSERTVFALSQLSREADNRPPVMSDLKNSSQLEQDANAIIFIHNPEPKQQVGKRQIIIAKNKSGKTGIADMWFDGRIQRFTEIDRRY